MLAAKYRKSAKLRSFGSVL